VVNKYDILFIAEEALSNAYVPIGATLSRPEISAKGIFLAMSGRLLQSIRMELGHLQTVQLSGDMWLRDDNGN